jgi:hypothetical protein
MTYILRLIKIDNSKHHFLYILFYFIDIILFYMIYNFYFIIIYECK